MHCSFLKNECRFSICWYYLIIIIVNNNFYSQQLLSFLYFLHFQSVDHHEHDVRFFNKIFITYQKKKIAIISYTSNTRLNSFYDPFYLSNMLGLCYLYTTLYSTDQNLLCILFYFPYKITEILKQKKKNLDTWHITIGGSGTQKVAQRICISYLAIQFSLYLVKQAGCCK